MLLPLSPFRRTKIAYVGKNILQAVRNVPRCELNSGCLLLVVSEAFRLKISIGTVPLTHASASAWAEVSELRQLTTCQANLHFCHFDDFKLLLFLNRERSVLLKRWCMESDLNNNIVLSVISINVERFVMLSNVSYSLRIVRVPEDSAPWPNGVCLYLKSSGLLGSNV